MDSNQTGIRRGLHEPANVVSLDQSSSCGSLWNQPDSRNSWPMKQHRNGAASQHEAGAEGGALLRIPAARVAVHWLRNHQNLRAIRIEVSMTIGSLEQAQQLTD